MFHKISTRETHFQCVVSLRAEIMVKSQLKYEIENIPQEKHLLEEEN